MAETNGEVILPQNIPGQLKGSDSQVNLCGMDEKPLPSRLGLVVVGRHVGRKEVQGINGERINGLVITYLFHGGWIGVKL